MQRCAGRSHKTGIVGLQRGHASGMRSTALSPRPRRRACLPACKQATPSPWQAAGASLALRLGSPTPPPPPPPPPQAEGASLALRLGEERGRVAELEALMAGMRARCEWEGGGLAGA